MRILKFARLFWVVVYNKVLRKWYRLQIWYYKRNMTPYELRLVEARRAEKLREREEPN